MLLLVSLLLGCSNCLMSMGYMAACLWVPRVYGLEACPNVHFAIYAQYDNLS